MEPASALFAAWMTEQYGPPLRLGPPRPDAGGPLAPLYRGFDGQLDGPPLIGAHRILPLEDALDEKVRMDALATEEGWDAAWWSPDWHPFAEDGAGQLLVVDGSGAVLEFLHDDDARPDIASDLDTLFHRIRVSLQRGSHVYDPTFGIGTPEELAAYQAARAHYENLPPRPVGRPNAALLLGLVPTFAFFAIGVAFDLGAGFTAIGATVTALVMTLVGWWLGWVVLDDPYVPRAR